MERRGQQELINSTRLPVEARGLSGDWNADGWVEFEALGFVKGEPVEGDGLFVNAQLPEGWTRQSSDHAMWSYIVDERGVRRVAVFYKAAFYDRRAHMNLTRPGRGLAGDVIYGDGPVDLPPIWSVLTADERQQTVDYIADYRKSAAANPDIWGDRLPRVDALETLINAN